MARRTEGWKLHRDPRTKVYFVRFRHGGQRFKRSTGEKDAREAQKRAEEIYSEATASTRQRGELREHLPLDRLLAEWLVAIKPEVSPQWHEAMQRYAATHWLPFFQSLRDAADVRTWDDYSRARLKVVKRTTLLKELSAGRRFLKWCQRERLIESVPTIDCPVGLGVMHDRGRRQQKRVDMTVAQVDALLAALPERTGRAAHPVRAFYTFMWETGLRRGTLWRIRAEDYHCDRAMLRLRAEADKSRYGRELPLSSRACAALDSVDREVGLIFGKSDLRRPLRAAAKVAGIREWKSVSNHDFRHARLTAWSEQTTDVAAFQYLAGHKHMATTSRYIHPAKSAAERLVQPFGSPNGSHTGRQSGAQRDDEEPK